MSSYKVSAVNEDFRPLHAVAISAISLNNWPNVSSVQKTDRAGTAFFTGLDGPHFFSVEQRRIQGEVGGKHFTGEVKLLVVSLGEGVNVDYVVDSHGMGTHILLFGATGALKAAVATGVSKTIWVCTSHVETVIASYEFVTALSTNQRITILSASRHRPIILVNIAGPLFVQKTGESHGTNSELRIQGLAFSRSGFGSDDFYEGSGGGFTPNIELEDVTFLGTWTYLFDWNTTGSVNIRKTHLRRVTSLDPITGIVDLSTAQNNVDTFLMRDCTWSTLTYIIHRTNNTDLDAGTITIVGQNKFSLITGASGLIALGSLYFIGNVVSEFSGTTSPVQVGNAAVAGSSNGGDDSVIDANFMYCSQAGSSAIILTAGSGTLKNISLIGNALRGPGSGTAIKYNFANQDCPALNAYRDWTINVGGTVGPGTGSFDGSHSSLTGLVAPKDDHTQYVYITGRAGGQSVFGGTAAGENLLLNSTFHATKGLVQVAVGEQLSINDSTYLLFRSTSAGAPANYGHTTTGGSTYTIGVNQLDALKVTLPSGIVTSLSVNASTDIFSRTGLLAIYDATGSGGSPGALLAYTTQFNIDTGTGLITKAIAFNASGGAIASLSVVAGDYWIAINSNAGGGISLRLKYDAGGVSFEGNSASLPASPTPPENPWSGGAAGTKNITIYATETPTNAIAYIYFNGSTNRLDFDLQNAYYQFFVASTEAVRISAGGIVFNAIYTATGDLEYASAASTPVRLGIGSAGQLLVVSGGVPVWQTASSAVAHTILSATHTDSLAAAVVAGDLIIGNATPAWARLAISVPAANVRNVLGTDNGDTLPAWKTALDATAPTTSALGDVASSGTSLIFSHRDHKHGRESFATNAILLGTAAVAGVATTPFRSDDTIAAFDATVPTTIAAGDAAATGSIAFAARRDHKHGSPATWPATAHNILSATHGDSLAAAVVDGDIIIGNVTPAWSRLAISVPAANILNVIGVANGETRPSWKSIFDATAPTTIAAGDAATAGTSLIASHRDHRHGSPATYPATAHNILSVTHGDSTAAAVVRGDLITGQGASPTWARLAASVPAANVRNVLGLDNGDTESAWKTALDATNPAAVANTASPGTSLIFSHRDHVHAFPVAKRTILCGAGGLMPTTTAGATDTGKVEISAQHDYYVLDFPDGAAKVYATVIIDEMPSNYDGGTITCEFIWAVNSTSTNGVQWGCQLLGLADGTALSASLGTAQEVTDAGDGTVNHYRISPVTSAITPGGTAAGGNGMLIVVYRDPTNGSDTLAATARLIGITLIYSTNAYSDR